MSDAMLTITFLTFSGGLQDAYSYCMRGKVFANAQTGNIVLMSGCFFDGDFHRGLHYLIPVLAFVCGVFCGRAGAYALQKHETGALAAAGGVS